MTFGGSLVRNARFGDLTSESDIPGRTLSVLHFLAKRLAKSVKKECLFKSVQQECLADCPAQQECPARVSSKECPARVSSRVSSKSV